MLQHVIDKILRTTSAETEAVAPKTTTAQSNLANVVADGPTPTVDKLTQQTHNVTGCNGLLSTTSTANAQGSLMSNISMPLAVPLSGLTTIPLALCAMNGSGNMANNAVQTAGGVMTQPSIVLLNVGGNTAGLTDLSKLLTCQSQLQQPIQLAVPTENNQQSTAAAQQSTILPQTVPNQSSISAQQTPLLQQTVASQTSMPQVLGPVPQVPLQPSIVPQQAPTAYMLVPVHHMPANQTVVQSQQLSNSVGSSVQSGAVSMQSSSTASINPTGQSLNSSQINTPTTQDTAAQPMQPVQAVISTLPLQIPNMGLSVPNTVSSSMILQPNSNLPTSTSTINSAPTLSIPDPVNDPHISSSVPGQVVACVTPVSLHEHQDSDDNVALQGKITTLNQIPTTLANAASKKRSYEKLSDPDSLRSTALKSNKTSTAASRGSIANDLLVTPEKRKKGPAPKLDGNELCSICNDKASGYHYGVLSCEGCKGFFRRCIIKNSTYKCKADGQCRLDSYTRRKCQACRLLRCRKAGMKDESVLQEDHSGSKSKKMKKDPSDMASQLFPTPDLSSAADRVPTLSPHQLNVVEMLQANENRYQWPSPDDVERLTPWTESGEETHRSRSARFNHFTELTILIVQLVVEFTKQLPGFLDVSREDQIILLKACTIEVMLLRAAKQYDKKNRAINVLNGKYYDKSSFYKAGMQIEFVDPIFDFCKSMAKLDLDEAEYALLVAINTFSSDRPNLKDLKKIEAIQDQYVELLRVYLKIHHPADPLMFPRTLMKLVELRTLNSHHSEQIFALKVQDKQLPPLLAEIWDM